MPLNGTLTRIVQQMSIGLGLVEASLFALSVVLVARVLLVVRHLGYVRVFCLDACR